jgi:oxygen-independent coproporphyrinogen-3 oxidase
MHFTQPLPLSLYVHYPWCIQKCPYCDFNSHTLKADQEREYIDALIRQLEQTLPLIWGRPIQTIFFGGGTPSLMSEAGLDRFLSQARALLGFQPTIEITLEANPGTVDFQKFKGFKEAGITRLSMGIQSFEDEKLKALGRIHSSQEAQCAIEAAKEAGFSNFNLDLMFGLPNQTVTQALADVQTALSFEPPHLSHYQLTLEPNTPFYRQPPVLPEDETLWEMQEACQAEIAQAGYRHYEVSAYAKPGRHCQHNLNYWLFGDYVGLGAGAHGKLTLPVEGKILRTQMPASPGAYMNEVASGGRGRQQIVTPEEAVFEFMLNALRLQQPIDLALFEQRTGLPISACEDALLRLQSKGYATLAQSESGQQLALTEQGHRFLNDVVAEFL